MIIMDNSKEQFLKVFKFRHACKEFDSSKKISELDFSFILETGRLSPSSFGFEPWDFVVIQNPELREKLRAVSWGAQKTLPTASHFVAIFAHSKEDTIFNSDYIYYFMKEIQNLSEEVLNNKKEKYKYFQENDFNLLESDRTIFDWACRQTYIALANMMTAAAYIGIDSCPIEGFDKNKVEAILESEGILDKKKAGLSCMVAFGYRKSEPRHPKTRRNLDQIVKWA